MTVYFRAKSRAIQTEYWHVEAPSTWSQMDEAERLEWLEDNLSLANFDSEEHHCVKERTILDYRWA